MIIHTIINRQTVDFQPVVPWLGRCLNRLSLRAPLTALVGALRRGRRSQHQLPRQIADFAALGLIEEPNAENLIAVFVEEKMFVFRVLKLDMFVERLPMIVRLLPVGNGEAVKRRHHTLV